MLARYVIVYIDLSNLCILNMFDTFRSQDIIDQFDLRNGLPAWFPTDSTSETVEIYGLQPNRSYEVGDRGTPVVMFLKAIGIYELHHKSNISIHPSIFILFQSFPDKLMIPKVLTRYTRLTLIFRFGTGLLLQ